MSTRIIQVRADPASDPDGSRLGRLLSAHLELERAVSRRVALVHLAAVLAVPVWLCAAVPPFHAALSACLWIFAGALAVVALAVCDEGAERREARRAARGVESGPSDLTE